MEEDIKILEEIKKKFERSMKIIVLGEYSTYVDNSIFEDIKKLINISENLIARYKELETIVKTYNAIPNDYMSKDVKIVIADREYFNNGILKENLIPKSKVQEKIEELKKYGNNLTEEQRQKETEFLQGKLKAYEELLED